MSKYIELPDGRQAVDLSPSDMVCDKVILPFSIARSLAERVQFTTLTEARRTLVSQLMECLTKETLIITVLDPGCINQMYC